MLDRPEEPASRLINSLFLCALLILGSARAALAQESERTAAPLGQLGASAVVRATLPDGRTVTGRFLRLGDGRLGVRAESGFTDTLSLAQIRTLEVRGRHTKTGAIVGGAAGLAAGIFFGYLIGAVCDAAECDRGQPYLLTIPLFGGGGTLLGAAIGAAVPKWKQAYP